MRGGLILADNSDTKKLAAEVEARAAALMATVTETKPPAEIEPEFVKACLDANERGDGILYVSMHAGEVRYNTTPKDGQWYYWTGVVWEEDRTRRSINLVEDCALLYLREAALLDSQIAWEVTRDRKDPDYYDEKAKEALYKKYKSRVDRLRKGAGAYACRDWAAIVNPDIACESSDFDRQPWLLPVQNGVIDLKTGHLAPGRPEDMLSRQLDIEYDPEASYDLWEQTLLEICGRREVVDFIKRTFGYAITGLSIEQYIWVFVGPGRNGKGILFNMISEVMGAYYHEINRGMILEQRNEPSPSAASEHKHSLLGKRIIVGSETNKNQAIDAGAVKQLTGEDKITCRPNFQAEISFTPTHTLFLHTNHIPRGLTRDFALLQRLLRVEFPYMFVDDIAAESKKAPSKAHLFRQKDPDLKNKLKGERQGILRWLVEGCLEWQQTGLAPPKSILDGVAALAEEEDHIGAFIKDCLAESTPETRISSTASYNAFRWWWSQNMDTKSRRVPALRTINTELRNREFRVEKVGGKTWLYGYMINPEISLDVDNFISNQGANG